MRCDYDQLGLRPVGIVCGVLEVMKASDMGGFKDKCQLAACT